jgi:hypothetical protein
MDAEMHCCKFCHKILEGKIGRHYSACHKKEDEVFAAFSPSTAARHRKLAFNAPAREGNFNHNRRIREDGRGSSFLLRHFVNPIFFDDWLHSIGKLSLRLRISHALHGDIAQ